MEFYVRHGKKLTQRDAAVLVGWFEGETDLPPALAAVDRANGGTLSRLLDDEEFRGKARPVETALVHLGAKGARRVIFHGLGKRDAFDADVLRRSVKEAVRTAAKARVTALTLLIPGKGTAEVPLDLWVRTATESIGAGTYDLTRFKGKASTKALKDRVEIETATFLSPTRRHAAIQRGLNIGRVLADATSLARDLGNTPANAMTPTMLAARAREAGKSAGLKVTVWGPKQIQNAKMGGLMGVAQGSREPARFIIMEHIPARAKVKGTWCIVGKGLTFDSGGISLKPGASMDEMKFDMCGGAATIGVMQAVGMLRLPIRVLGIVPATENMPGGRSYRPGDVLTISNGTTVEIMNTDAEGRLILADALAFAAKKKPKAIVDMATLTGACVIALGRHTTGLVSNDDDLCAALTHAGIQAGDRAWRLPLSDDYREQIKSDIADIKNTGGRPGGAITAGAFLEKFVDEIPWAHLDIAGTGWTPPGPGPDAKSATGAGVRIVSQYLMDVAGVSS